MSKRKPKYLSSEEGYNLVAGRYDEKEGYLNSFEQKKLLPLLGNIRGKKILDAGAGTGRLAVELAKFPGAKVTALDVSAEMLDRLKKKNQNIECVVGDAENLPFMSGSFDVVLAAFLMVHLKDPRRFFDEAYRVLKDGGIFLALLKPVKAVLLLNRFIIVRRKFARCWNRWLSALNRKFL